MLSSIESSLIEDGKAELQPAELTSLNIIRTETVLSRLPIHNLAKRGTVDIHIIRKNARGELSLHWEISYGEKYGNARQLAYRLDTLVINRRIHEYGRPVPKAIYLGSLRTIAQELGLKRDTNKIKKALLQNAFTGISAYLQYTAADGTKKKLQGAFTRYEVWFYGDELPDGSKSDAVYIVFHDRYREVLNSAETRPLDYDYIRTLAPTSHRFYELVSYKVYAAIKHQLAEAKMLYSEFCTFAPQQRYYNYDQVKKQMYKVHRPHITSSYIKSIRVEATTDNDGKPDWILYYVPGAKACAEYEKFTGEKTSFGTKLFDAKEREAAQNSPPEQTPVASEPIQLVKYFYKRFHRVDNAIPGTKALGQASKLITEYGFEKALFIVDFAYQAAREANYKLEFFGGVLEYTPRALGVYEQLKKRETQQYSKERVQWLQEQYEEYRRQAIAQFRATMPPDELAAIETNVRQQLEEEGKTPHVAMNMVVRVHTDALLEERAGLLSFESWKRDQQNIDSTMADVRHEAHNAGACHGETQALR
jgi:hypothetical protein